MEICDFYSEFATNDGDTSSYNLRILTYPDGTQQFFYMSNPKLVGFEIEERQETGLNVERKKIDNSKRAMQKVYNLARSNNWDWFLTMTLSPDKVDRYDYDDSVKAMQHYCDIMRKQGNKWLMVPEQHKDGAWHFHALVEGPLKMERAVNPKTGEPLSDRSHRPIYNVTNYKYGYTTITPVGAQAKAAGYLTKYLSKKMDVPKGRKRYWASKSLLEPDVEYYQIGRADFDAITMYSKYEKVIETDEWGTFILREV